VIYNEKLKDPRWQRKRLQILERDGWQCLGCGNSENTLHVHHLFYIEGREPWEYPASALRSLCVACHENEKEDVVGLPEKREADQPEGMLIPCDMRDLKGQPQETCLSSDIHDFLEIKTRHNDWIGRRLSEVPKIQEDVHYSKLSNETQGRGAVSFDYILTLDTAKHIIMLERNNVNAHLFRQAYLSLEKRIQRRMTIDGIRDRHKTINLPAPALAETYLQVALSKDFNTVTHAEGGQQLAINMNAELCREISDMGWSPKRVVEWAKANKDHLGLTAKDLQSAQAVFRAIEKSTASAIALAKHLLLAGNDPKAVYRFAKDEAKPFYEGLLRFGKKPPEMDA